MLSCIVFKIILVFDVCVCTILLCLLMRTDTTHLELGYKSFMHGVYGNNLLFTQGKQQQGTFQVHAIAN